MDEQDTIQGTPTGAAQEPAQDTRTRFLETLQGLRAEAEQVQGTGRYVLIPTEALTLRAAAYFDTYRNAVAELFDASGIDTATTEAVIQDYAAILSGVFDVSLSIAEQERLLRSVKLSSITLTERYALALLFSIYLYNTRETHDYIKHVKNADGYAERTTKYKDGTTEQERIYIGVEQQRANYLSLTTNLISSGSTPRLAAACWWTQHHTAEIAGVVVPIVAPADFVGFPPETVNNFFAKVEAFAFVDFYVNYYYIAKYALRATPEELAELPAPPLFAEAEQAREYAERIGSVWWRDTRRRVEDVEKLMAAETPEQLRQAKQAIRQEDEQRGTIRVPETIALLGSREVYASADGTEKMGRGILPIQAVITDYMTRHQLTEQVTPRTVEKVIEGVNLLQHYHNVKPVGGVYRFETNISEFSQLCGYTDANQTQKMELWRGLQILDKLFLAVWRPEGLKAVRVFTVQEIGLSGEYAGGLILQVNADVMRGHPNLITYSDFDDMRKASKGQAENHFRNQIISKGQKEENALLNEVFGYDALIDNIKASGGTADDVVRAKRNNDKHKSRDRRKLLGWFEDYKAKGWLEYYTRTKNAKGEYVYKWKRKTPEEQAPDEQ